MTFNKINFDELDFNQIDFDDVNFKPFQVVDKTRFLDSFKRAFDEITFLATNAREADSDFILTALEKAVRRLDDELAFTFQQQDEQIESFLRNLQKMKLPAPNDIEPSTNDQRT